MTTAAMVPEEVAGIIRKLDGVHSATVVTDAAGSIEAVCVVADKSANPKWLVRSVKNLLSNAANVWLDYRKISVVLMSRKDYERRK